MWNDDAMNLVLRCLRLVLRCFRLAHPYVKELEPWSVLIAAIALVWTIVEFRIEREDRRIDDVNRALALFAENAGRHETLEILLRNDVDLVGLVARDAYLRGADLEGVDLGDADLNSADLRRANLKGAHLSDADLDDVNLAFADLTDAFLYGADLSGADLGHANLSNSILVSSDLTRTKLIGADLTRADLRYADLSEALTEVDPNLTDTDVGRVDFDQAILCGTTMPDGSLCNRDCPGVAACPYLQGQAQK
jgi:uncharacterized protein YjbI with pentapeptide repeats